MALKRLGRLVNAQNAAVLYSVPAGLQTVVATLVVLNRSANPGLVRVTHALAAAADTDDDVVLLETVRPGERLVVQEGWCMAPTDALRLTQPATFNTIAWGDES